MSKLVLNLSKSLDLSKKNEAALVIENQKQAAELISLCQMQSSMAASLVQLENHVQTLTEKMQYIRTPPPT
jgi:hypothetical protein